MKFSGVITTDRSDVHAKGQSQRSKVKVTEVKTQVKLRLHGTQQAARLRRDSRTAKIET